MLAAAPSSQDVFALFDHVLSSARLKLVKDAKPIAFELVPDGETWMFQPKAEGPLFSRAEPPADPAVLRLRCEPALLARLVTDPSFELKDEDEASYQGDINDLLELVAAFEQAGNAIGIRAKRAR